MKNKVILASLAVILLCMSIIVGVSYGLFTDVVSVKNHLRAGNLDIALTRTNLVYTVLDDDGYLTKITVADDLDLTHETGENAFGINTSDMRIVPGSYFDAELMIENRGNVAFTYSVGIRLVGNETALADQLMVTLTDPDGKTTAVMLSELADGHTVAAGRMASDADSETFHVKVEFVNDTDHNGENGLTPDDDGYMSNNTAQGRVAVFDLVVTAVQATSPQN